MPAQGGVEVAVGGQMRPVCCMGCQAAAMWIQDTGLGDFYRLRDAVAARDEGDGRKGRWGGGDRPQDAAIPVDDWSSSELLKHVVRTEGDEAEVMLVIEGMRCAACSWLIERLVSSCDGVRSVQVNGLALRARIVFDPNRVSLAHLLERVARAGYRPLPLSVSQLDDLRSREARTALKRLLVAGFGAMQAMMFSTVLYVGGDSLDPVTRQLFAWLSCLVASPVVLYAGAPFFRGALQLLRVRHMGMDIPVALAIGLIYGASLISVLKGGAEVYFDSVAMFVFFLLCGRHLEMRARHRAVDLNDAAARLTPTSADRREADGSLRRVAAADLRVGDRVHVVSGQALPADGVLIDGPCLVDESLLTGESVPVSRDAGAPVIAGSLMVDGRVDVEVTRVGAGTTAAAILALITRAQLARPRLALASERGAALFVARVLILSVLTACVWWVLDPTRWFDATLAVLVISCPCALALAAPTALTRAMATLAGRGILIVDPDALEGLAQTRRVLFDKTGTLTDRSARLERIELLMPGWSEEQVLGIAAALARESRHPVSESLVAEAQGRGITPELEKVARLEEVVDRVGQGVEARIDGGCWRLGRAGFALAGRAAREGLDGATVLVGPDGAVAAFHFVESLRPDARTAVARLGALGLGLEIASGDAPARVGRIAGQLGIRAWQGDMLPGDKLGRVEALHAQGVRIAMVGDGINDAPVLARADVSVAMAGGADLAQAGSGIVLCGGRLEGLADAVVVARQTLAILRQNQHWAIAYNLCAVPVAAMGWVPPWLAALGMSLSSLVVVMNGQRIRAPAPSALAPPGPGGHERRGVPSAPPARPFTGDHT